jgi:hypothetical protein
MPGSAGHPDLTRVEIEMAGSSPAMTLTMIVET